MTTRAVPPSPPTLTELLAALEEAVRARDRVAASRLEQAILRRIAVDAAAGAEAERQVRDLLSQLDLPVAISGAPVPKPGFPKGGLAEAERRHPLTRGGDATRSVRSVGEESFSLGRSVPDPEAGAGPRVVYPVWFGTNRRPLARGTGFGPERHDQITRGRVEVRVPEAHRFGETGSSFWTRLKRFDFRDDRLRLQSIESRGREAFYAEIAEELEAARESSGESHALVFLHGFNVTFEEAAIRAAQIGVDLKVPGATAFFSWPSRGTVRAYPADEASIEASEGAITEFLVDFATRCGAEKIHVLAHSMGNRGLLRALQRIAAGAETRGKVRFGQIFLAAPDIDRDLFLDLAGLYPRHGERTTLYTSAADLPVHLSSRLHEAPRAGYFVPYTVAAGIDTIAVPDFDIDLLGHSYFAQAEAMLHDLYDLLRHGAAPDRRQRIDPALEDGQAFWKLRR